MKDNEDKQKLRDCLTIRHILKNRVESVLQAEGKGSQMAASNTEAAITMWASLNGY